MKIIRLQSSNIKRLVAVDITPEGHLVTIGGKNGAGKSSVLDSLAMALGGAALVPAEPIRAGESEAVIKVTLEDLVVTRRFYREQITADESAIPVWGEIKSVLTVTNAEGAKYPSPQAMLDKLLGRLTFDPLAFSRDDPKRQAETLRKLVGLDTSAFEQKRAELVAERSGLKKTLEREAHTLAGLPFFPGVPEEEIPLDRLTEKIEESNRLGTVASQAVEYLKALDARIERTAGKWAGYTDEILRLEKHIENLKVEAATAEREHKDLVAHRIDADLDRQKALDAVPDIEAFRAEAANISETNKKILANQKKLTAEQIAFTTSENIKKVTSQIEAVDHAKLDAIQAAKFPVEGLGLSDEGVTFGGLPFSQASSSEQLRVSVAIGLALNPKLKVLLVRNGNLLDDDSIKLLGEQAEAADAQVLMEYVTSDADKVSVMIEDGKVK